MNKKLKLFKIHYFCFGNKYESLVMESNLLEASKHIIDESNEIEPEDIVLIEEIYEQKGRLFDKGI